MNPASKTRSPKFVRIGNLADIRSNVHPLRPELEWQETRRTPRFDTSKLRGQGNLVRLPLYMDQSGQIMADDGSEDASGVIVNVKMDPKVVKVAEDMTSIAKSTQQALRPAMLIGAGVLGILLGYLIAKLLEEKNKPKRRKRARDYDEDDD